MKSEEKVNSLQRLRDVGVSPRVKRNTEPHLWLGLHLNGRATVLAGLGAGMVFLVLELLTAYLLDARTPFGPAHVTLQGFIGAESVPGQHNPGLVLAGLFAHFCLSVLVTIPLGVLVHPWRKRYQVVAVGFVYGYVLYFINFFLFAIMLPVLGTVKDLYMLIGYALFGLIAAWLYITVRDRRVEPGP